MDFLKLRRWLPLLLSLLVMTQPAFAVSREYKLKAAFILNFIKFVEWPSSSGPINVGILGTDTFEGELKKLESKTVGGRKLKVSVFSNLAQAKNYQVVYASDAAQAQKLVKTVQGLPVLTISDTPGFSKKGGGIGLVSARNRIRFSINSRALKQSSLKASSKLLNLATNVYSQSKTNYIAKTL